VWCFQLSHYYTFTAETAEENFFLNRSTFGKVVGKKADRIMHFVHLAIILPKNEFAGHLEYGKK